ncbi:DUF835 domain-containing protein [Thermococcus pacificus]|uniref:DUF835 domain-containing protein n=1 Tax=Thermococcus pacificus TaxID=71998 RepID=A0A218P7P7_9EURY|nr:DUF835 domain-containing protein [Thermococcus pacificus]ASJ06811.1 hypothetical protein A3L08_05495 [Thermococcus pacificus]
MTWDTIIAYLNIISRWALFIAVLHKAYQTREKGWALLTTAFFIDVMDIEDYVLGPLGMTINSRAYEVASTIPNFFIAILLVWGAIHLKYGSSKLKHVLYISGVTVVAYVWIFLLATDLIESPSIRASVPSLLFGLASIYFGRVLLNYVVSSHWIEKLFPWGLILLGALNLIYPIARFIDWFAPIGFLLGAVFRFIAAIGALKFVFYPVSPVTSETELDIKPGAFMLRSKEEVLSKFGEFYAKPGTVLVTREDIKELSQRAHPETLVFWITRSAEGKLSESPTVYATSPTRIDILTDLIAKAVSQGYHVVYIDAFEYLMLENSFENAVKFLLNVKDRVISSGGTLILVINPDTLTERQRKIIEREFGE